MTVQSYCFFLNCANFYVMQHPKISPQHILIINMLELG